MAFNIPPLYLGLAAGGLAGRLLSTGQAALGHATQLLALHRNPPPASVRAYVPAAQSNEAPAMPAPRRLINAPIR